jgi:glycosyltransferase involved in cell wall biosynthesis
VLIGEGAHRESLEAKAKGYGLRNLRFLSFVPAEQYPQALAASDIQLVVLNEAATYSSLPSKVLKIMASGRPVLALAQPESELSTLVGRAGCGVTVRPGDAKGLADVLRELARQPERLEAMGERARRYLLDNFESKRCIATVESVLRQAARA